MNSSKMFFQRKSGEPMSKNDFKTGITSSYTPMLTLLSFVFAVPLLKNSLCDDEFFIFFILGDLVDVRTDLKCLESCHEYLLLVNCSL